MSRRARHGWAYSSLRAGGGRKVKRRSAGGSFSFARRLRVERLEDRRPLAAGDLDSTFGGDGKAITDFGGGNDSATSVALQADGKMVVAGYTGASGSEDFAVVRYNTDGSLDTSFDGDGKVITNIFGSDRAFGVAIQTDGRIVVVGTSSINFAVVRYNIDGSLDTTFDGDGKVITDFAFFGSTADIASSVAIQADGKIVVAGRSSTPGTGGMIFDFALARYNTDGSTDTSFGGGLGRLTTDIGSDDAIASIALATDGKIVAVGSTGTNVDKDFAAARYNAVGSLDTTFDGDGMLTTVFGPGIDGAADVVNQADGKLVAAGSSAGEFALVRYHTNGSLDTSFDGDGKLTTALGTGDDFGHSVALQGNGKILVAGSSFNGVNDDFALARYNTDGSLDISFSGDGKLTAAIGTIDDHAHSVALQVDGKIVVGGQTQNGSSTDFTLARYLGDLPGDYNRDDVVDAADYVVWRKTEHASVSPATGADGNGNGAIGPEDLSVWKTHFGLAVSAAGEGNGLLEVMSVEAGVRTAEGRSGTRIADFRPRRVNSLRIENAKSEVVDSKFIAEPLLPATVVATAPAFTPRSVYRRPAVLQLPSRTLLLATQRDGALAACVAPRTGSAVNYPDAGALSIDKSDCDVADVMLDALDSAFDGLTLQLCSGQSRIDASKSVRESSRGSSDR